VSAAPSRPTSQPAAGTQPRVQTPCVVHSRDFDLDSYRPRGTDGQMGPETRSASCYVNAACIAQHGVNTQGDALPELECAQTHCVCRIEFLEPQPSHFEFKFEAEAACDTDEQADRLLLERCVGQSRR
jgi:hypothetical protein